jgi:hypothetical protein
MSLRLAGIDSPELPLCIVRAVGSRRRATGPFHTSAIPDKVASTLRQEDRVMSIVVRFNPTDKPVTADKYDEAVRRHAEKGIELPPDGMEYHVCFGSAESIRVSEIWDSREQWEAYGERLMPLLAEVGIEPGEPEVFEVHNIIRC